MANLIEYIQSQVYENSTEDISGSIMQQVLTRMASDEGVVNVHTISGQTPFADYNNAQAARDAVPAGFKKLGLIITYKLSSGWYIDEFIGSATSGWSTASNWKCLGPISVSQNASTGKTTITIGSESFDVATQPVSVSQNSETGHIDITIGDATTPVAGKDDVIKLNANTLRSITEGKILISDFVLNEYLNTAGDPGSLNGWAYSRFIEIVPNTNFQLGTNELGYVLKYYALYDKERNFISGSFVGTPANRIVNSNTILALFPNAKYIGFDIVNLSESSLQPLTPSNISDWAINVTCNTDGSITTDKLADGAVTIPKIENAPFRMCFVDAISKLQYAEKQIVLNALVGTNGGIQLLNGWGCIRYIELTPNTIISMGENSLNYIIKYRALYDADKQFISGSFAGVGTTNSIDMDSILNDFPTAKYIGIDLIDPSESGSETIFLDETNTADWEIVFSSKIASHIDNLEIRVSDLENEEHLNKKNLFIYSSGESSIKSPFDNTNDFKLDFNIIREVNNSQNPCFNFTRAKIINKSTSVETQVHSCSDDICPGNYNGTYIGANHGQDATTITAANHGKSYADIGSKWTDGEKNFYIVAIISANEIQMLSDNQSEYPLWSFVMPNVGTLTHVSGATHTEDIVITARTTSQMHPIMSLQSTKIIADGKEITEYGIYRFNNLKISQIYDVRNAASVLIEIVGRVGQFTANPIYSQLGADKVMRHSITYEFNSAQECLITTDFLAYQNVSLGYFGFTQQGALNGDNVKMYIPKALPISNGQTTLDFRTIAEHNSVPSTMNLTSQYWENELLPPDRWIQFANNISFVGGYLFDRGVGGNERKNVIDNAFFLYTSRKCYPHGIDSKINLQAGQSYGAVNIRKYLPIVSSSIPNHLCTQFEYNDSLYVYFDAWDSDIYAINIPDKYIDGNITIFEKSENTKLISSTVNTEMLVQVSLANPMYGYLVMRITK